MIAYPCGVCKKPVGKNHNAVQCDLCQYWVHIGCNNLNKKDYAYFNKKSNEDVEFFCINCLKNNIPFCNLNNNEFSTSVSKGIISSGDNSVDFTPTESQKRIFEQLNHVINNSNFYSENEDDEMVPGIHCKYYSVDDFCSSKFNPSKTFSVLHYNIHSVARHIGDFNIALEMLEYQFDVICLSESKIIKDVDPIVDISIDGYQPPVGTPTESTKGGVLIYVKNDIKFKPRNDLMVYKAKELESCFIEIINKKESNNIVGVMYRHPCMSEGGFIDENLRYITDNLSNESKKVFIAGDFNFDLLNSANHDTTFEFFDTMMSNFLLPVITLPTKINPGRNTLIDNIFTNQLNPDAISGNLEINLSDGHLPSFLIIPKQNQNHLPKKHNIFTRSSKNFNREEFLLDYLDVDWNTVIDTTQNNVNYSINNFLTNFNSILDVHMPFRKKTRREFKQKYKPWISNHILSKISEKNKVLRKYISSKDPERKSALYDEFKAIKNEITFFTRSGKNAYYKKYFSENKNNLQKIWKGIKEIINIKSQNYDHPTCIEVGDDCITDPISISNSFNDYFTSIADNIIKKRKYNGTKSFRDFLANRMAENFTFDVCTEEEVKTIISSLNIAKSSGPNSIPTNILHLLKEEICNPLTKIYNLSLSTGKHPDVLKISKTIPVYKKGSRLLVGNYRPISLLSNLNKILEKIVHNRVYTFLEDSACIYSLQFGFRKKTFYRPCSN